MSSGVYFSSTSVMLLKALMNSGVYFSSTSMMLLKALMNSGVYFSSTSMILLEASRMLLKTPNGFGGLLRFVLSSLYWLLLIYNTLDLPT
jgi:hypothetical protein